MKHQRERRFENLLNATDENAKMKILDHAAEFYIKIAGDTTVVPTGAIEQLMGLGKSNLANDLSQ